MKVLYKTNCAGPYHIENDIPCQDSYAYENTDEYIVAAVADGLGSCKYSDIASKIASESAVAVCAGKLENNMSDGEIIEIMRQSFMVAEMNVRTTAKNEGRNYSEYETTLCLAIYDGRNLYYGQSGDSGLIALLCSGEYIPVTSQQRDNYDGVSPLSFGLNYWVFGKVERDVCAFTLMTDGIWDKVVPKLLSGENTHVNVPLAEKMLNYFELENEEEISELEKIMDEFWKNCPDTLIDDDKTTICVINTDFIPERRNDSYYKEPDWEVLNEKLIHNRNVKFDDKFEDKPDMDTVISEDETNIETKLSEDKIDIETELSEDETNIEIASSEDEIDIETEISEGESEMETVLAEDTSDTKAENSLQSHIDIKV